jgi:carboxymethylenebutenolidase
MDQRIIDLYDAYTHGGLGRHEFFDHLNRSAGSTAAAGALLAALTNDYARASLVAEDDPRLQCETIAWDAAGARVSGYLARLRGHERHPALIVVHENRGLNPHIRDVARRFASEGFLALAPDALSPLGGTPADEDKAREMIGALDPVTTVARLGAAVPLLAGHPESNHRVGAVGFCWGGGMVNRLAAAGTALAAAVAYYGQTLPPEDVPRVDVPLLLHYAGKDERINAGVAAFEAALRKNGKSYQAFVYEGAQHAFNNDTNTARYDKVAADLAWGRTLAFLRQQLAFSEGSPAR